MAVTRNQEIRIGLKRAFEDAVVVRIIGDGANRDPRYNHLARAPQNREHFLQHGPFPAELLRQNAADLSLNSFGKEQLAPSGVCEF